MPITKTKRTSPAKDPAKAPTIDEWLTAQDRAVDKEYRSLRKKTDAKATAERERADRMELESKKARDAWQARLAELRRRYNVQIVTEKVDGRLFVHTLINGQSIGPAVRVPWAEKR